VDPEPAGLDTVDLVVVTRRPDTVPDRVEFRKCCPQSADLESEDPADLDLSCPCLRVEVLVEFLRSPVDSR
jgi:hypothetical protein